MEDIDKREGCDGKTNNDKGKDRADNSSSSEFPSFVLNGPDLDKGWAWFALFSSFLSLMLLGLCYPMQGFVYVHHLETFEKDPALTACIGSSMTALVVLCGPVSSWVSRRFGRRVCVMVGGLIACVSLAVSSQSYNFWLVFVTSGILAGFGLGLMATPAFVNIGCYFVRRRALFGGISTMGFSIGVLLSPPIIQYLESIYGWRGALLIFAGLQLNVCVMGIIMHPSPLEKYKERIKINYSINEEKDSSNKDIITQSRVLRHSVYTNTPFYFFALSFLFTNFAINVVYVHLARFMYTRGGTAGDIQMLYSMLGLTGLVSKVLTGLGIGTVKNGISLNKVSLLFGSFSIVGTALLAFPSLSHTQSYSLLCMFFVGLFYNVEVVAYVPICVDVVGLSNLGDAIGLIFVFGGFGFLTGPPLAAFITTRTKNYDNVFYMAGAANFLAVLSLMTMALLRPGRITEGVTSSTNNKIRETDLKIMDSKINEKL